ncbi:hypothetical protein G6F46_002489 [Rhizopus delemar]|uniref:SH3 domain-containing protein n=2 Tax=Rhizopus TaxID=4842 RepID=A0A9P6ZB17_9FUNG|nr:hypothetical protein G6F55_000294 [Rhizopus delemar]KAG1550329.1 hypothetical protein G6F51_002513 [Rhizopus arrhizus]KAG1503116.1 hypothetical protein G6F54_001897 [Rhizopus delemar]KAG1516535.1 hypothetical protein G6F53_002077 [Rhizopus delemar]KAG1528877.1 hypothetical protein G6F52_000245 [Rhizopus delemar]
MTLESHFASKKEIEEQKKSVTVAEQVYKRSVDNLNAINEKWIHDWKHSAEVYQELELKRITYLRNTFWSFSNMMTSTFSIDEECCDRIRTALEITNVQKDITDFVHSNGTGTKLPSPLPYELFYKPVNRKPSLHQASTESLSHSIIVLTNPDEELKSVDRQLQQLEQSQSPTIGKMRQKAMSTLTDQAPSKEPKQPLPPIIDNSLNPNTRIYTDQSSVTIHSGPGIKEQHDSIQNDNQEKIAATPLHEMKYSDSTPSKDKPVSNPIFGHVQPEEKLGEIEKSATEINSAIQEKKTINDSQLEQEEAYHNRMPKPLPKDEKWVISSIRRSQQVPVAATATDNQILTDNDSIKQGAINISASNSPAIIDDVSVKEIKPRHPKLHRPIVPLTIEIPNLMNDPKPPQLAAHQAIEDARRHSQMSPIEIDVSRSQNRLDDHGGIRPAPWQSSGIIKEKNEDYMPQNNKYYSSYQPDLAHSSLPKVHTQSRLSQSYVAEEEHGKKKKSSKNKLDANLKSGKEPKTSGRFSLFFTGGHKKDKKKEKGHQLEIQKQQQYMFEQKPSNHQQSIHQQPNTTNHPPIDGQVSTNQRISHRFLCYVRSQWPFEATIDGEMSFNQHEVLGILHKQSDGWWQAERLTGEVAGQRGLVPGNYMIDVSPTQHH